MRTTYKNFKYECSNCATEVNKIHDVSKLDVILGFVYCEKCGNDTLVCVDKKLEGPTESGPAIIGERWEKKLDGDFKYMMKNMKKRHRNSNIPDY